MSENQNIEYKESWRDEYLKWICGFANAQGGKIYIGKDDTGKICGVKNSKKLLEDIPNKIRNTLGIVADVNLHSTKAGDYIEIIVEQQPYPISYYGEYHYRSGSTKQQLTGQHLNQFLLKKTGITWDSVPVPNVPVDKLRNDAFDIFREQAVKNGRMSGDSLEINNADLLDGLNLLDENGIIKKAGIMLFHHNPEKWVPGAYIKIAFFSSDSEIEYQDEVHGALIAQPDKIMDLLYTKYLKAKISYDGITRIEKYPYPKTAVREAILNAIAHKDYAKLTPIQIRVYDHQLIISNDCIFPDDWTVEDLLKQHKSRPYNPLIANSFYRAGFIESWGRGIQKIHDSCAEYNCRAPEYQVKKEDFSIVFRTDKNTAVSSTKETDFIQNDGSLTEVLKKVFSENDVKSMMPLILYMEKNRTITTKKAEQLLSKSNSTAYRYIRKLVDAGILISDGNTNNAAYIRIL